MLSSLSTKSKKSPPLRHRFCALTNGITRVDLKKDKSSQCIIKKLKNKIIFSFLLVSFSGLLIPPSTAYADGEVDFNQITIIDIEHAVICANKPGISGSGDTLGFK